MAKIEFEWSISDPIDPDRELVYVRERLVGTDQHNLYGPMRIRYADSFIKARRAFVHRRITTRFAAMQMFEQQRPKSPVHPESKARQ